MSATAPARSGRSTTNPGARHDPSLAGPRHRGLSPAAETDAARSAEFYRPCSAGRSRRELRGPEHDRPVGDRPTSPSMPGAVRCCGSRSTTSTDAGAGRGCRRNGHPAAVSRPRRALARRDRRPGRHPARPGRPRRAPQPQTLLAVADVEAASLGTRRLLGLTSDHGGPNYERLLADGTLVLQLHRFEVESPPRRDRRLVGDARKRGPHLVRRSVRLRRGGRAGRTSSGAEMVRDVQRNPPEGGGNGPGHRELWLRDLDGYTVVVASPDGEAWEIVLLTVDATTAAIRILFEILSNSRSNMLDSGPCRRHFHGDIADLAVRPRGGRGVRPMAPIVREELGRGAWVDLLPGWFAGADELFDQLVDQVPWRAEQRQMYERVVDVPRLLQLLRRARSATPPEPGARPRGAQSALPDRARRAVPDGGAVPLSRRP